MSRPLPSSTELLAAHAAGFANVPLNTQGRLAKSHSPAERRKRLGQIFADQQVSGSEADELEYLKEDQENEEGDGEMAKAIAGLEALAKGKDFWEKEDDDTSETAISPAVKAAAIKKFGKWSAVAAAWAVKKQKAKKLAKAAPKARRVGFNPGEPDFEGGMAKSQLRRACKYAEALEAMLKDGDELPAWVQDKISKASEYLDAAYHFLDYQSNGKV